MLLVYVISCCNKKCINKYLLYIKYSYFFPGEDTSDDRSLSRSLQRRHVYHEQNATLIRLLPFVVWAVSSLCVRTILLGLGQGSDSAQSTIFCVNPNFFFCQKNVHPFSPLFGDDDCGTSSTSMKRICD